MGSMEARVESLEERMDAAEQRLLDHGRSIHQLKGDRATIRLLAKATSGLIDKTEDLASAAANKALQAYFEQRRQAFRESWSFRLKWVGTGCVMAGTLAAIVAVLHG